MAEKSSGSDLADEGQTAAVAPLQAQFDNAGTEGRRAMMVLSVDIVGHGAAERDEAGARRGRQEPAVGHNKLKNIRQAGAGFCSKPAGLRIEGDEAREGSRVDDRACAVQTGIAIGAPQADRKFAFPSRIGNQSR